MGELGALFNPGMRHELEERQAKAARREEEGNARDGDLRIDLESGVAVINVPGDPADEHADGDAANADATNGSSGKAAPTQPAGRHAAGSADDTDQAEDTDQADESTKPDPPV